MASRSLSFVVGVLSFAARFHEVLTFQSSNEALLPPCGADCPNVSVKG